MTLRDLFRWAERFRLADDDEKANGKQLLAENGTAVIHFPSFTCIQMMLVNYNIYTLCPIKNTPKLFW